MLIGAAGVRCCGDGSEGGRAGGDVPNPHSLHGDGTVSFKTNNGHFLVAEGGGGQECNANRRAPGPWEKFYMVPIDQSCDKFALKTFETNQFVSVEKEGG